MHRYLTKLSDQVICLMSKEHSDAIVWNEDQNEKSPHVGKEKPVARNRQYTFLVQKTKEQEEGVSMHDGFKVGAGSHLYVICFLLTKISPVGNSNVG